MDKAHFLIQMKNKCALHVFIKDQAKIFQKMTNLYQNIKRTENINLSTRIVIIKQ